MDTPAESAAFLLPEMSDEPVTHELWRSIAGAMTTVAIAGIAAWPAQKRHIAP